VSWVARVQVRVSILVTHITPYPSPAVLQCNSHFAVPSMHEGRPTISHMKSTRFIPISFQIGWPIFAATSANHDPTTSPHLPLPCPTWLSHNPSSSSPFSIIALTAGPTPSWNFCRNIRFPIFFSPFFLSISSFCPAVASCLFFHSFSPYVCSWPVRLHRGNHIETSFFFFFFSIFCSVPVVA
jgi:hypothetical protein